MQTGAWVLYEYENGKLTLNQKPKELKPVAEYFRLQRRFKGVPAEALEAVEAEIRTEFAKLEQEAER